MPETDLLILGAGPAGCATALALRDAGIERVTLVDRPLVQPFRIGESATPDIPRLLTQLGLPKEWIHAYGAPYHANLSLWGGVRRSDDFLLRGQGHGWHLDRAAFDAALREAARARGVELLRPAALTQVERLDGQGWSLQLQGADGQALTYRARFIVDAAGRRAPLATRLGATRHSLDRLVALAQIHPDGSALTGHALVEPCADGWWYAARLPDGRAIVTLMSDADLARERGWYHAPAYRDAWRASEALHHYLPPPTSLQTPAAFPAHSGYLDRAAGEGWLAVGDALIGFDPLTSSGIAGALSDALAAVEPIKQALAGDTASKEAARRYAQRANTTLQRYLEQRQQHYRDEARWRDRPFWARRNGAEAQ